MSFSIRLLFETTFLVFAGSLFGTIFAKLFRGVRYKLFSFADKPSKGQNRVLAYWLDGLFFYDCPLLVLLGISRQVEALALIAASLVAMSARALIARELPGLATSMAQKRFWRLLLLEAARVAGLILVIYTFKIDY